MTALNTIGRSPKSDVISICQQLGVSPQTFTEQGNCPVRTPITGETIAQLASTSTDDVTRLIGRSAQAYCSWREVPPPRRGELVRLLGNELRTSKKDLARIITIEAGKILSESEGEVQEMIERWRVGRARRAHYTAQEVLEPAAEGNVMIRGWGATYLLRGVPNVACVRICAPMDARVDTMMKRMGVLHRKTALREIRRSDAAHNGTMQRLFGIDWSDPALYSIVLNTQRIPVEDCANHIVEVVQSEAFRETKYSSAVLNDELVRARVLSTLDKYFSAGDGPLGFDVGVEGGHVTMRGTVAAHPMVVDEAESVVCAVEGVKSADNKLMLASFE